VLRCQGASAAAPIGLAAMSNLDLILTRQSPLSLRAPGPDGSALQAMLATAMSGPDHGKLKPWRFIVIDGEGRRALGRVLRDAFSRRAPDAPEALLAREEIKPLRAPTIVVVVARVQGRKAIPEVEQVIAAGIAAYNILLAAHALGLGGMWRTGTPAYDPEVRRALRVEAGDMIVGFLYLGTPDVMPRPREIGELADCVSRWPQPGSSNGEDARHEP